MLGLSRSVLHYASQRKEDGLQKRLIELAGERRRFGYRRLHILVEREGFEVNHKRVHRLYRQAGLAVRQRRKRAPVAIERRPLQIPPGPNHTWSMDFVFDALASGKPIKCLTVVDDCTKESVEIAVARRINGQGVADLLDAACRFRGYPSIIRTDQGPEFTGRALDQWAHANGVKLMLIQPGKPTQNAYIESFNGRFGLVLVAVFFLHAWRRVREGAGSGVAVGALLFIALIFTAILPLLGSRAGVIVAMLMLVAVLPASGWLSMRSLRESRWLQVGALLAVLVFAIGLRASLAWMTSDAGDLANEGSRFRISVETLGIGSEHAPLGSGIGSFVAAFQQGASEDFLMNAYVNNAHNEYAQWWLEGDVLGVMVMLLALAVLARALFGLLRMRPGSTARVCGIAAMMGIGVIVLHSTVDYPLRTQALMAVFSVLCGIAVGAAGTAAAARAQPARRA